MTAVRASRRLACLLPLLLIAALASPTRGGAAPESAYDFEMVSIEGEPLPLSRFAGRPILLVNTASFCGFTPQYEALQALWEARRDEGLVVLGVPSDDFGGQEYQRDAEIKRFCEATFGIDFPMAGKAAVQGPQALPLYRWLAETLGPEAVPRWNFHKVLIGRDGRPVGAWPSRVAPDDPALTAAIDAALRERAAPRS